MNNNYYLLSKEEINKYRHTFDLYNHYLHDNEFIPMNEIDINFIYTNNDWNKFWNKPIVLLNNIRAFRNNSFILISGDKYFTNELIIGKVDDEYYLIEVYIPGIGPDIVYKCDQLHGVIECINFLGQLYNYQLFYNGDYNR